MNRTQTPSKMAGFEKYVIPQRPTVYPTKRPIHGASTYSAAFVENVFFLKMNFSAQNVRKTGVRANSVRSAPYGWYTRVLLVSRARTNRPGQLVPIENEYFRYIHYYVRLCYPSRTTLAVVRA